MGPSVTIGAVNWLRRRAPTKVVVFQCPCGAEAMQRLPFGDHPQRRVMLVDVHVSSMNVSFSTSIVGNASTHARRACRTSSRSCSLACRVFFEGEIPFVQLMPQCAGLDQDTLPGQPLGQFGQGKIWHSFDPGTQHRLHLSYPRTAMAADLKAGPLACLLLPIANLINPDAADFQTPRNRARPLATIQRPQYALTQILRIRLHPAPSLPAGQLSHEMSILKLE